MKPYWRSLLLSLVALGAAQAAKAARPFEDSPFGTVIAATGTQKSDAPDANRLALLSGGYDALLVRVHLIRHARTSVVIQTFIWTNDEVGRLMMYELVEAARRGVKVRIIADHLVSEHDPATIAFLATVHPNLEIKHYRPTASRMKPTLPQKLLAGLASFHGVNQRMHNKVMIVDGAVLITGGRNIENTYYDHSTGLNFRDRDVLAVGPVVHRAVESFEEFWHYRYSVASRDLADVAAAVAQGRFRRYATRADYDFGGYFGALDGEADDAALIGARFVARLQPVKRVAFVSDEPGKSRGFFSATARLTRELSRAVAGARQSIVIQTPYLVLSPAARELFRRVREQHPGLRIRVSSNSFASTDNLFAYSANYRLRTRYVSDLHLEVHEFKPRPADLLALFPQYPVVAARAEKRIAARQQTALPTLCVHAKSLVVDDRVAFVGSYNLDPRSENLNTEAGLLVEDEAFATELRSEIERDLRPENSWVIGRRSLPLHLETVNGMLGGLLSLSPVDVWPVQNTSSFELKDGATAVSPFDPAFHEHYREVGPFPGAEGLLSTKEILTRLYKAVGTPLTPIL
ncbi:MAG: phospholipase D family protein [Opitutae bacterium]|nr:phospholipase D family protein [Opitutae bacterium]